MLSCLSVFDALMRKRQTLAYKSGLFFLNAKRLGGVCVVIKRMPVAKLLVRFCNGAKACSVQEARTRKTVLGIEKADKRSVLYYQIFRTNGKHRLGNIHVVGVNAVGGVDVVGPFLL